MALNWSTDVGAADWLVERIAGFAVDVGSIVPHGFEAYARVFHPLDEGPDRRWTDRAARNGRLAHPEMQLHLISHVPGRAPRAYVPPDGASVGSLPEEELHALTELLAGHTGTPEQTWFAVWDGWAWLHGSPAVGRLAIPGGASEPVPALAPAEVLEGPRLELPSRSYVLLEGAVGDAPAVAEMLHGQSPSLWWPEDRAWCVATEIDFAWTYIAGSEAAVADVLASPALEALPSRVTDEVTWDSDALNSALDSS